MLRILLRSRFLSTLRYLKFNPNHYRKQAIKQCVVYYNRNYFKYKNSFSTLLCISFVHLFQIVEAASIQKTDFKANLDKEIKDASEETLIQKSDDLFSVGKYEESIYVLNKLKETTNVEILWRLGRGLYNMTKNKDIKSAEKVDMINEAYDYVEKALKINDKHFAVHKWMAILIDAKSSLEGIKARILTLPVFKQHLITAMELNPKDATSIYLLGQYCYHMAEMPWFQRKIAETLLAAPPVATFEEALFYFSKAEEVEPNFYSTNLLMLGKTYLQLKRIEAAQYWLRCACNYPVRTDEDEMVRKEAEELLTKHTRTKISSKPDLKEDIRDGTKATNDY